MFGTDRLALGAAVTARVGRALAAGGLLRALAPAAGLPEKTGSDWDGGVQPLAAEDRGGHDPRLAPLEGEREVRSPLRCLYVSVTVLVMPLMRTFRVFVPDSTQMSPFDGVVGAG